MDHSIRKKLGWRRQRYDDRDIKYTPKLHRYVLPRSFDLRKVVTLPQPYDQGELGSCVSNGIAFCFQYNETNINPLVGMPSRLFVYYNSRVLEGTVGEDSGVEIRDGIKSVNADGVCDEKLWPYVITKFTLKPSSEAYEQAISCRGLSYYALNQNLNDIKTALYNKLPVIFGFQVYSSFDTSSVEKTGIMPIPNIRTEDCLGGHCVVAVGYDDAKNGGCIIVRNSWGTSWGDGGYFYMPYKVILDPNIASDFWVISKITNPSSPKSVTTPDVKKEEINDLVKLVREFTCNLNNWIERTTK